VNLLFKNTNKQLSLFATASIQSKAVGLFKKLIPNVILLARENMKLLKLIQKLTNKILNDSFNVSDANASEIKQQPAEQPAEPQPPAEKSGPTQPTLPFGEEEKSGKEYLRHLLKIAEEAEKEPEKPSAEPPGKTEEAGGDARLHQSRSVLIDAVKELLKFSRQTTKLVRGAVSSEGVVYGEKAMAQLESWLKGEASKVRQILSVGGVMDEIDKGREDPSSLLFRKGDEIIEALYTGMQKAASGGHKQTAVSRALIAINHEGGGDGLRFLKEKKKEVLLLIIELLGVKQSPPKKPKRTTAYKIDSLIRKLAGVESIRRYELIASMSIKFAQEQQEIKMEEMELIRSIVELLHNPQFIQNKDVLIQEMPDEQKKKIEEAMKLLGASPDISKLDAGAAKGITSAFQAFANSVEILTNQIAVMKGKQRVWLEIIKNIAAINSDPASRDETSKKMATDLTDIEDEMKNVRGDIVEFKGKDPMHQKIAGLYGNLVKAVEDADKALSGSISAIRKAIQSIPSKASAAPTASTAVPSPASQPQPPPGGTAASRLMMFRKIGQPAAAPAEQPAEEPKPQENPAQQRLPLDPAPEPQKAETKTPEAAPAQPAVVGAIIADDVAAAFKQNIDMYIGALGSLDSAIQQVPDIEEAPGKETDEDKAKDTAPMPQPKLSFKNDTEVAPILGEIKKWFETNEQLMAKVIKPLTLGTGKMGFKTKEDMRSIATMANNIKNRATTYIDQLLK
jgi:hypothetical protein